MSNTVVSVVYKVVSGHKDRGFRRECKAQTGQEMRGIWDCTRGRRIQD